MNAAEIARVLPPITKVSEPFYEGCRQGELRLQFCRDCERFQFYPRILCSHCGSEQVTWVPATGRGSVASFTVVRRGISPAYPAPYIVALVDMEEGPRMMSNIVGCDPDGVAVGDKVTVEFEAWTDEVVLPVFRISE